MTHFTVSELAFGSRGDPKESVCILADVRDQSRPASVQVYSYGKEKIINLPRSIMTVHTPRATHWWAVSIPRWLVDKEGLWGGEPAADPGDAERIAASRIIKFENRDVMRPGDRTHSGGSMGRMSNAGS
ncbi:hypothetical protein [Tardiphaga sp.]|uniref:hypothetical protein n=1 Tax=Tardiphaga sp. TaxID=1926292 RepID=UPI002608F0E2|nr:hypothetical protein [Tardiphaga sp.]MDB5618538.1 hypothetical protein [Tardiphaga sp.]